LDLGLNLDDCFWPADDGLHQLNASPKPDAQGAASKISFAVLYSSVARPGFGQKQSLPLEKTQQKTARLF
jgi:hypothetical protein